MLTPRQNPELFGQDRAEQHLRAAYDSGRLHHGWILAGAPGIGKATLAFRFARFLLTKGLPDPKSDMAGEDDQGISLFGDVLPAPEKEPEPDPACEAQTLHIDPDHQAFKLVASSGHPDLLTIQIPVDPKTGKAKTEIPVDEIRKVVPFLRMTASMGGWRVVIIDGADTMGRAGQNAILKILEEPPDRAVLILTTVQPAKLLPTIRSRCQLLPMDTLSPDIVARLTAEELADWNDAQRHALGLLAEGSLGRARQLLTCNGLEMYRDLGQLLRSFPRLDWPEIHRFSDGFARIDKQPDFDLLSWMLPWRIERMLRSHARSQPAPNIFDEDSHIHTALLSHYAPHIWLEKWETIRDMLNRGLATHLDRKHLLVNIFAELVK